MNLFQTCLKADEKVAAEEVTEMIGSAQPSAIWAILMHAAAWHEQAEFDTPHSTIVTHSIHQMIEDLGPHSGILTQDPSETRIGVPKDLKDLLQLTLIQRLARYLAAIDHYQLEKGPRYDWNPRVDSLDNILYAYAQAIREHSHIGALKEAVILGEKEEPIRLIRRTANLAADDPDNLGHGFIMPVSLLLELPSSKFKLPHKGVLWHLTEYLVRKVPSKKPDGMVSEENFKKMADPTDVTIHSELFKNAVVEYGILGHNGIFAQRIAEAASLGLVSSTTIDWLLKRLKRNIGSKIAPKEQLQIANILKNNTGTDWTEQPSRLGLPKSKELRTWLEDNVKYWELMMDLSSSTFESVILKAGKTEWPIIRAAQYGMSVINGSARASHVIIFTQAVWSLTDMKLISEPLAALQVHRMLRQYLNER